MTKNKDQILKTTSLSLILVLLIMIGFLMVKVNELQDQLYNLNNELSSVRGAVNSINGNIRSEFDNILDELEEQAKNFSNVSTTILDYEDGFLTVNIKFTLKEITNGSIVKVICENTKTLESTSFTTSNNVGNIFEAELKVKYNENSYDSYNISYELESNEVKKTESMITLRPYNMLYNRFSCKASVRFDHNSEEGAVYDVNMFIYNYYYGNERLKISSVELLIGDEIIDLTSFLEDDGEVEYYTNYDQIIAQMLDNEEHIETGNIKIVDNLGFTYYF